MKELQNSVVEKIDLQIEELSNIPFEYEEYVQVLQSFLKRLNIVEKDINSRRPGDLFFQSFKMLVMLSNPSYEEGFVDSKNFENLKSYFEFAASPNYHQLLDFIPKADKQKLKKLNDLIDFINDTLSTKQKKIKIFNISSNLDVTPTELMMKLNYEPQRLGVLIFGEKFDLKRSTIFKIKTVTDIVKKYLLIYQYLLDNKITEEYYEVAYILLYTFKTKENIDSFINGVSKLSRRAILALEDMEHLIYSELIFDKNETEIGKTKRYIEYAQKYLKKTRSLINDKLAQLNKQKEIQVKAQRRKTGSLSQIKSKITEYWSEKRYISLEEVQLEYIIDLPVTKDILEYVFIHNQPIFKKLYEDNKASNFDNLSALEKINLNYSLPFSFSKDIIHVDSTKVEEMLKTLSENELKEILENQELLENILINSTNYILKDVITAFKENNISLVNISFYPNILIPTESGGLYERYKDNLALINKYKYQIEDFSIYLEDQENLVKRIRLVEYMKINLRKNSNNNDQFLRDSKTFDYFDRFIEQGCYSLIRNHLPYCNENSEIINKRLVIADKIELETTEDKDFTKAILTGNGFVVDDMSLDEYLDNYVPSIQNPIYKQYLDAYEWVDFDEEDNDIIALDNNYKISDQEYSIDGIIISRMKVKRYLKALKEHFIDEDVNDLLFNAIIYNSLLNLEQVETIYQTIYQKELKLV